MSDLCCPATLLVTRHAEAEYDTDLASDDGGCLTLAGRGQARQLADTVRDRKVAGIWCSDMARAVQTAEIVAGELGLPVRVRAGLREFPMGDFAGQPYSDALFGDVFAGWLGGDVSGGCPGAEPGADVIRRLQTELDEIADQFRGETVLVVSHGGAMSLTLPRLARNVGDDYSAGRGVDNCGVCEVSVDADGWVLRTWNGAPIPDSR